MLEVRGLTAEQIGDLAFRNSIAALRAHAAAGFARGGVHEADQRRGRVPAPSDPVPEVGRMSAVADARRSRGCRTRARSRRLRVIVLRVDEAPLAPLDALLAAAPPSCSRSASLRSPARVVAHHWPQMSPHDKARLPSARGEPRRRPDRPARARRPRRARDHRRVLDRMIRATMTAVPKRLPVLWAKTVVFGLVALALTLPATLIAFFVGQAILSRHDINIAFTHPGRRPRRPRRRALPDGDRPLRARHRRDRAQHGRRDRDLRRDHVRAAAADERAADELEQRGLAVPPAQRRRRRSWR